MSGYEGITYDEYLAREDEANYEAPPYVPPAPLIPGKRPGWEPDVTYGYSEFGHREET